MATEHENRRLAFQNIPQLNFFDVGEKPLGPSHRVALGNITNHETQSEIIDSRDKLMIPLTKDIDKSTIKDDEDDDADTYFSQYEIEDIEDTESVRNDQHEDHDIIPDSDIDENDQPNLNDRAGCQNMFTFNGFLPRAVEHNKLVKFYL